MNPESEVCMEEYTHKYLSKEKKKKKKVNVNVQYLNQSSQFNKKKTSPFVTTPKEFDKIWNKILGKLQHLLFATAWE